MEEPTVQNNSTPPQEKTIQSLYSYEEVINWLEIKGREIYWSNFKIHEIDYPVIYKLIAYYLRDEQACSNFGVDINKGILLSGPIGCGKTAIMNLMKFISKTEHKYYVKPCRDISFEFIQDGYQTIHKYSNGKLYHADPKIICFDDLGTENNLKYFGNECNVMAEILLSRYDIFISKRIPTHLTTNLSASEIETHYGLRVRSRLRQMVNLITYDKNTIDKR
ncbi:ATPase [Flavobacterium terrisoli]|uniref:ATPase n=1 Tax=Flavobacterium terrisoli TaxID=3242195 RepID=UPI002543781B|nr:ATPase [Flavobacterium buctense]